MTPDRFDALAAAYGADLDRWPADHRVAGRRLAAGPDAATTLAAARDLDRRLAAYAVAEPSADLQRRVLSIAAGRPAPAVALRRWLSALGAASLLGAGIAGAGAAAGMAMVVALAPPHAETDASGYAQSSFGDIVAADASPSAGA